MYKKGFRKDITGTRFWRWTVTGRAPDHVSPSGRKRIYWFCICDCGRQKAIPDESLRIGHSKSCGCLRKELFRKRVGESHHLWKGGFRRGCDGYMIRVARWHPAADRHGLVREHRLVMEEMIGRHLLPGETVHHKNGIKDDNRPVNLELRSGIHAKGFRYEDLSVNELASLSNYITTLLNEKTVLAA